MVFTSVVSFVRSRGPDEFWRKRRIFKLAAVIITLIIELEQFLMIFNFSIILVVDVIVTVLQLDMYIEHLHTLPKEEIYENKI